MRTIHFLSMVTVFILLVSCNDDIADFNPEGDVRYVLTFQGTWKEADHGSLPDNAHFTSLIGLTHKASFTWFAPGMAATAGVEEVAETGLIDQASDEIDDLLDNNTGFSKQVVSMPGGPVPAARGEFTAKTSHPYLSIVSMIAPSPDWFVGVSDFPLYTDGEWVQDTTFDVGMYDAGTEDGDQFSLDNPDSDPRGAVMMLTPALATVLANGQAEIASIGTLRIRRIE